MVTKISKFIGIPANLKSAKEQLDNLLHNKGEDAKVIRTEKLKGKYLCIKKKEKEC